MQAQRRDEAKEEKITHAQRETLRDFKTLKVERKRVDQRYSE